MLRELHTKQLKNFSEIPNGKTSAMTPAACIDNFSAVIRDGPFDIQAGIFLKK